MNRRELLIRAVAGPLGLAVMPKRTGHDWERIFRELRFLPEPTTVTWAILDQPFPKCATRGNYDSSLPTP